MFFPCWEILNVEISFVWRGFAAEARFLWGEWGGKDVGLYSDTQHALQGNRGTPAPLPHKLGNIDT